MSEQKLRRKSFISALGAMALGAMGSLGGTRAPKPVANASASLGGGRVVKAPRAVPRADRRN